MLTVVNVSLTGASPCVHIFPAVLALAKNFVGYASFARLLGDASDEARALTAQLNVVQVRGVVHPSAYMSVWGMAALVHVLSGCHA